MSTIWSQDSDGWRLLAPTVFPDEDTLHTMVEQAPQMLPLAGSPSLVIVGREVQLGSGYADLLAIEPSGRLVVIEVKLGRNAEARRAIVAQVLTYAAYLRGMEPEALEQRVLARHLPVRGYATLAEAALTGDQSGSFDASAFAEGLSDSLSQGRFRLVLVLDEAPSELVRLVGYLEAVTDGLLIDLVTVSAYMVGASRIIVPQRVEPEAQPPSPLVRSTSAASATASDGAGKDNSSGRFSEGAQEFLAAIEQAPPEEQEKLKRLTQWAISLENEGLVTLGTFQGVQQKRWTLLPRLRADNVGLVTIWNERGAYLQFWRTVFERRAPASIARIEELIAPASLGKGTTSRTLTEELLSALTDAYREAAAASATLQKTGPGDAAV